MLLEMQSVGVSKAVQLHLDDPQKKRSQPVHPGASNQSFLDLRLKVELCGIKSPMLMISPSTVHSSGSLRILVALAMPSLGLTSCGLRQVSQGERPNISSPGKQCGNEVPG